MRTLRNKVRLLTKVAILSIAITVAVIFYEDDR